MDKPKIGYLELPKIPKCAKPGGHCPWGELAHLSGTVGHNFVRPWYQKKKKKKKQ